MVMKRGFIREERRRSGEDLGMNTGLRMSNISTIATYLARFSGQLQPMLEKVQGMDRRTFLLETAALLALSSCSEPSGKAGMAPMISPYFPLFGADEGSFGRRSGNLSGPRGHQGHY
jgi:hypothetical protein